MSAREASILAGLSHGLHKIAFFDPTRNATAANLADHVKKANWDIIKIIWMINPGLMFTRVKDENGMERSPLEWSFYLLDTYTWKPFYEWIQENKPELADEFHLQKSSQQEHINIEPLLNDAYPTYSAKARQYIAGEIDEQELDRQWIILGENQKKYLPMHMLKEMCRLSRGDKWDPAYKFDDDSAPTDSYVRYCDSDNKHIYLDSDEFSAKFGVCFSLKRSIRGFDAVATNTNRSDRSRDDVWPERLLCIDANAATFRQLYQARVSDLSIIASPVLQPPSSR